LSAFSFTLHRGVTVLHETSGTATENLKEEHRVIERMLRILTVACDKLDKGEEVSPKVFMSAVDFIRTFADSCHHGKEEDVLFPMMEKRGFSRQAGPVGVMLMEHDQGRRFVRVLAEAVEKYERGDKTAKQAIILNVRGYAQLLAQHIPKEDGILYPLADKVLGASDQKELLERFEKIEKEKIGERRHREYLNLVARLEKELNIN
jgi:hemerythrin-like domain-containing protein